METKVLLSTAYFPPIQYMSKIAVFDQVFIEASEHYEKQSYRNRCRIIGPNGIQTLSIPVIRGRSLRQNIRDVRIDFSENWQGDHRRSIETAYASAPFFDFYWDDIRKFFKKKYTFLFDYNLDILCTLIDVLEMKKQPVLTKSFQSDADMPDFRESIHPKQRKNKEDLHFRPQPYTQVFSDRHPFISNLSLLDLLFNEGPLSQQHLLDTATASF